MDHRSKNTLFLGIVAAVSIVAGYIIVRQTINQDDGIPPALKTSKERAQNTDLNKTPVRKK